jgi:thioredoxin-like negative regulator of GroEL
MLEFAKENPATADWDAVRVPLLAANKIDPEAAEPLRLFFETYVDAGVQPTKNALDGLAYALVLAPQDVKLRMELVGELINENKLDDAREALKTLAYSPHQGKWHDAVLAIFEQLNAHNQSLAKDKFAAAQKYFDDD